MGGGRLVEPDQVLRKAGMLGSQLYQARVWQEIRQQGEQLTLGPIRGIWGAETGLWLEQVDIHAQRASTYTKSLCGVALSSILRPFHSNTNRNPWAQGSKAGDRDLGQV